MSRRLEITGRFRRDEGEACRLAGPAEQEASDRKRDPFSDVELPLPRRPPMPDPFSDVDAPPRTPRAPARKPNPFNSR